jgi:hypothetical protein
MRSLTVFTCTLFFFLLAAGATLAPRAVAAGPQWIQIDENGDSVFSYDKNATSSPKEGIVRVRTRVIYTAEGKADALRVLKTVGNMSKLYESRYLHDLDCSERESHLLEATHLDKQGAVLRTTDLAAVTEWEGIPPDARMDLVFVKVCTQ